MSAIYDHLISVMLVGAVMLILIGVSRGMTQSSVDAVQTRADAMALDDLDALLEADLSNLGEGVPAGHAVIVTADWGATTPTLVFNESDGSGGVRPVRYQLLPVTDPACGTGPCFRFERSVDAGAGFQPAGGSVSLVRRLDLDFVSPSGVLDESRVVEVDMVLLPRFDTVQMTDRAAGVGREHVWQRRIPLLNLRFRNSV